MADHNWSSHFARLRTESVVVGLIFFSVAQLPVNLKKVPLLGIEFTSDAPIGTFLLFLLSFWLYLTVAWWLRFKIEIVDAEKSLDEGNKLFVNAASAIQQIEHIKVPDDAITRGREFQKQCDRMKSELTTMTALCVAVERMGQPSPIELSQGDIRADFSQHLQSAQNALSTMSSNHKEELDELRARLRVLDKELPTLIQDFKGESSKLLTRLRAINSVVAWEKRRVGFWVPFAFSVGLVFFAFPQFLLDVAPTLNRITSCIAMPEWRCVLRPESVKLVTTSISN